MANKNKAKGTTAESNVVKFLQAKGYEAKRQPLAGGKDIGDIEFVMPVLGRCTMEVKAGKQTYNPRRSQIEEWIRQAKVEAKNNNTESWYLVVVRYQRALRDADVYTNSADPDIHEHFWLGEFAEV